MSVPNASINGGVQGAGIEFGPEIQLNDGLGGASRRSHPLKEKKEHAFHRPMIAPSNRPSKGNGKRVSIWPNSSSPNST